MDWIEEKWIRDIDVPGRQGNRLRHRHCPREASLAFPLTPVPMVLATSLGSLGLHKPMARVQPACHLSSFLVGESLLDRSLARQNKELHRQYQYLCRVFRCPLPPSLHTSGGQKVVSSPVGASGQVQILSHTLERPGKADIEAHQ